MFENFQVFLISLGIGMLIGMERERSHPIGQQAFGVRTFMLFALLGTLAAYIQEPIITISLSIFVFGVLLLGYWRSSVPRQQSKHPDIGITTEVAAAIVFCLGFVALKAPLLAAVLGGLVLLVLLERKRLHTFSRTQLQPREIEAAALLIVFALGVLPFLPAHTIDPWELFNPRRFGVLVVLIASVQFAGYIAIRIFGEHLGTVLMGFFGGLVSSTAVFASLPRIVREHAEIMHPAVAAATLATVAMLIELSILLLVASQPLFLGTIAAAVLAMMIVGSLTALVIIKKSNGSHLMPHPMNPLDVKSILRLSFLIGGMIALAAIAQHFAGAYGIQFVAFFGGLFEIHSVSLAVATMFVQGKLSMIDASVALALALLASFISKYFLLWTLARNRFAVLTSIWLTGMLAAGAVSYWLVNFYHPVS